MMMIYPSNLDNNKVMTFRDNTSITCLVSKQEDFKSIDNFYKYLVGNNIKCNIDDIGEAYVRYYSILPKKATEVHMIAEGEGYTFCKKGRGAYKVYVLRR